MLSVGVWTLLPGGATTRTCRRAAHLFAQEHDVGLVHHLAQRERRRILACFASLTIVTGGGPSAPAVLEAVQQHVKVEAADDGVAIRVDHECAADLTPFLGGFGDDRRADDGDGPGGGDPAGEEVVRVARDARVEVYLSEGETQGEVCVWAKKYTVGEGSE